MFSPGQIHRRSREPTESTMTRLNNWFFTQSSSLFSASFGALKESMRFSSETETTLRITSSATSSSLLTSSTCSAVSSCSSSSSARRRCGWRQGSGGRRGGGREAEPMQSSRSPQWRPSTLLCFKRSSSVAVKVKEDTFTLSLVFAEPSLSPSNDLATSRVICLRAETWESSTQLSCRPNPGSWLFIFNHFNQ